MSDIKADHDEIVYKHLNTIFMLSPWMALTMLDAISTKCMSLVVLMSIAMLQLRRCGADLEIRQSPESQVILLGDSATFNCSASDGTFELIVNGKPFRRSTSLPELGITAVIHEVYNDVSDEADYTASVIVEGTRANNNTEVRCVVFTIQVQEWSNTSTLTVIGPPDTPSMLTIPNPSQLILDTEQFVVIWAAPYSHMDHPILHYTVNVTNLRTFVSYEQNISPESLVKTSSNVSLEFPQQTSSCDVIIITVTAVNDIGHSEGSSANMSIPEVPKTDPTISTEVLFTKDGSPIITLEIKFPELCSFERLNYTVYLVNRTKSVHEEFLMLQKSVATPPESVTESIAGVVPNTEYSVVVQAETEVWDTSTTPYNFSTHFLPSVISTPTDLKKSGLSSSESTGVSSLVMWIIAGAVAAILLLVIGGTVILVIVCHRRRRAVSGSSTSTEIGSVPYNLTPNPIYDGPLYDTVQEPFKQVATVKSQPHPQTASTEPLYSESPTESKKRNRSASDYEELSLHQKDTEDCYIHMSSYKQL